MLPNFICPGAARSATTTLYYLLIQHPQIYLPPIKETRFFAQDHEKGLSWYEQKFYAKTKDEKIVGDISPIYLIHEKCPERIHNFLGEEVKLIFMLRNPVERAYSHYCMLKNHHFEDLSFEDALDLDEEYRKEKSLRYYGHEYGFQYLKESNYLDHIERYLQYFAKDKMKFVIFEEFIRDTACYLSDILNFLDVRDQYQFEYNIYQNQRKAPSSSRISQTFYCSPFAKRLRDYIQLKTKWRTQSLIKKLKNIVLTNRNTVIPSITDELRKQLDGYFAKDIIRLETVLDRDLSLWKQPESKA